jgi:hippurate hydrolase
MMRPALLGLALLLAALPAHAAVPPATLAKVNAAVEADTPRLTAIFKDLHQHPEIAFTESRTAAIVAKELKALGFQVTTGVGKTGVVGVFRNGPGKTLWFRADMDANAVRETTGLAWAATKPQRLPDGSDLWTMHACGHDAHVTWLLGLAKAMVTLKADWSGTLVVYGQPAEEVGLGAQAMVDDGMVSSRGFPKPDFGLSSHAMPGPVGVVASAPGMRMAGTDQLDVKFIGKGGHGSSPELAIDPIVMSAQAILGYQTIISRSIDPQRPAVLTVGAVDAGRDNNVIPGDATLRLNLRWFDRGVRDQMIRRIDEVSNGIATAAGAPAKPERVMKGSAGPLINDKALVEAVNPSLVALLGEGKVIDNFPSVMGSEDFQEVMNAAKAPYLFLMIGIADPARFAEAQKSGRGFPYSNHNSDFVVELAGLPVGVRANTTAALVLLRKQ